MHPLNNDDLYLFVKVIPGFNFIKLNVLYKTFLLALLLFASLAMIPNCLSPCVAFLSILSTNEDVLTVFSQALHQSNFLTSTVSD